MQARSSPPPPLVKRPEPKKGKWGKPYAGEFLPHNYVQRDSLGGTQAIIGYTAHLPGLSNAIGKGFPLELKTSNLYKQDMLKGNTAIKRNLDAKMVDKWGNIRNDPAVKNEYGNLYLSTFHPQFEETCAMKQGIGMRKDVVPADKVPPRKEAPWFFTREKERPGAPKHVMGYTGFREDMQESFGESYNKLEEKLPFNVKTQSPTTLDPMVKPRKTYAETCFSIPEAGQRRLGVPVSDLEKTTRTRLGTTTSSLPKS